MLSNLLSRNNSRALLFIAVIVLLIYSNSFEASWHFDDQQNILDNKQVHGLSFSFDWLMARSLSFASFALNWSIGRYNVVGYHLVNIIIHIANAFLIYLVSIELIGLLDRDQQSFRCYRDAALLCSILWAVHPIQTQAVTYIVQRMASLAAFFYLWGLLLYIRMRASGDKLTLISLMKLCGITMAAYLSKENGVLVVSGFWLVEWAFFRDRYTVKTRKIFDGVTGACLIACIIALVGLFYTGYFSYEFRSYTLDERLLTQPRVIWFYLSQILYPVADRFSLIHDYVLSTSLFFPITTFISLMSMLVFVVAVIRIKRHSPLLSFSVLFFFLNHLVESSFVPLEMIYEHRNYLPSMFLFVAPSLFFVEWIENESATRRFVYGTLVIVLVVGLSMGTYGRNFDWVSDESLWSSARVNAPTSARVSQCLLIAKLKNESIDLDTYYKGQKRTETMWDDTINRAQYVSLSNQIGALFDLKRYEDALQVINRYIELDPVNLADGSRVVSYRCKALLQLGHYETLFSDESRALVNESVSTFYRAQSLSFIGVGYIKLREFEEAKRVAIEVIRIGTFNAKAYALLASAFTGLNDFSQAEHYLELYDSETNGSLLGALLHIYLAEESDDQNRRLKAYGDFVKRFGLNSLKSFEENQAVWPFPKGYSFVDGVDTFLKQRTIAEILD